MDCAETRDRLVALDDGELGRSEAQHALEHLDGCASCRDRRALLQRATPFAHREPPPDVLARLASLDVDAILAGAPPRMGPPPRRFGRSVQVPLAAVMLYAFVLAAVTAWGLSNWWSNAETSTQIAGQVERSDVIPAQAWRPAAWTPDADAPPPAPPSDDGALDDSTVWH